MVEYKCDKCSLIFKQKNDYERHKKNPCVIQEQEKIIKTEHDDLNKLETLFNKLRDILRNNENITGKDALDVFSDFLILRLLKPSLTKDKINKNVPYIDLLEQKYSDSCDQYKEYLDWEKLHLFVKNLKDNRDKQQVYDIVKKGIFEGIFN